MRLLTFRDGADRRPGVEFDNVFSACPIPVCERDAAKTMAAVDKPGVLCYRLEQRCLRGCRVALIVHGPQAGVATQGTRFGLADWWGRKEIA
jgi:hypothetical protein